MRFGYGNLTIRREYAPGKWELSWVHPTKGWRYEPCPPPRPYTPSTKYSRIFRLERGE